ncbi:MAG: hypothetical protein JRJ19_08510 [Deltaproteobacteria bacterium]|nr:hypothetical protein [Deltaproteobacteria bacterium]MBW1872091.1 hypothetical protein [Deltaproteobacteria bacterium]
MLKKAALCFLVVGIFGLPTGALALVGDSDENIGLDGSVRTITGASVNYKQPVLFGDDNPADGFSQTMLRLTIGGRPTDWFSYEVHGLQDLVFSTSGGGMSLGSGMFAGQGTATRYRALYLSWEWADDDNVQAHMWLDRCNLKFVLPFADVTIGRQAITFGKAYFWNPLDVFLAFDPTQFDRDYKSGVDALRIDIPLGDFSGINIIGVLGRDLSIYREYRSDSFADISWNGSAALARVFTNIWEWDFAIQGGKVYGGYQVGGAASGELGPLAIRAELAYLLASDSQSLPLFPDQKEIFNHLSAVVGVGHRFENTLDIEAEYIYNGSGDSDNLMAAALRMGGGGSYHMGEHLLGVVASYEILPILKGSLAWIFSFSDYSSLIQPGLSLSVSDEADLIFGAIIGLGARATGDNMLNFEIHSEFGTYPNFYYMEFKFYF